MALKKNIVGVVASLIKVPQKFETAIEVALGGAVQNIVTFNEEGAKELIKFLKDNSFGRATFLPITSMKRKNFDERLISGKNGCYGLANKLIDYDKSIDNVISNLLGSTVIVDNLVTAVNMAKDSGYAYRIVTLDGDIVNPQGSLTGGSKKAESSNLIGREREIETLGVEIVKLEKRKGEIENDYFEINKTSQEAQTEISKLTTLKNTCEIELAAEKEKLNKYSSLLVEACDNLKVAMMESETVQNKLALIGEDLAKSQKIESALSGNKVDADELIKEKREKFEKLREKRDELNNNILTVKVEIAQSRTKLSSCESE